VHRVVEAPPSIAVLNTVTSATDTSDDATYGRSFDVLSQGEHTAPAPHQPDRVDVHHQRDRAPLRP
jgi:hypothetical protein